MTGRTCPAGRLHGVASLAGLLVLLAALGLARSARAEDPPPRPALFEWDARRRDLLVTIAFRDVVDDVIQRKLLRGLPTTIVFTGTVFRRGTQRPIATTAQTCKITWHVWDEAYRVELTRPDGTRTRWTATLEGVLRRCAEVTRLPAATSREVATGVSTWLRGRVQVNPVSPELLEKIKLWVSRPTPTGTAAPGDALFSAFTGIFMQRVSEAERVMDFTTTEMIPLRPGTPKNEG